MWSIEKGAQNLEIGVCLPGRVNFRTAGARVAALLGLPHTWTFVLSLEPLSGEQLRRRMKDLGLTSHGGMLWAPPVGGIRHPDSLPPARFWIYRVPGATELAQAQRRKFQPCARTRRGQGEFLPISVEGIDEGIVSSDDQGVTIQDVERSAPTHRIDRRMAIKVKSANAPQIRVRVKG